MQDRKNIIKRVENNKEKELTYRNYIKRFNDARRSKFYLEALWVLYAMLEDRTSSLIYYLGFTSNDDRNAVTRSSKIRKQIREIFNMQKSTDKYGFNTFSGKLKRIKRFIDWSKIDNESKYDFMIAIKKIAIKLAKKEEFIKYLDYLNDEWRIKRNQLTHSLFNKNSEAVYAELELLVDYGFQAARCIDKIVTQIKKIKIRETFRIL